MAQGVETSGFVIVFLSKDVLERPFVQFELRVAMKAKKRVLLMHEADPEQHFGRNQSKRGRLAVSASLASECGLCFPCV